MKVVYTNIPEYPRYLIDAISGNIYSTYKHRILKPGVNNGYLQVYLKNESGSKWKYVHIILSTMFITNPDNKPWVNHKDGIKSNNALDNLEWSTISENIKHAYDTGLKHYTKFEHKPVTKETRIKQSKAKLGKLHPKFKGYYITPKGIFESSYQAAIPNNLNNRTLLRWCKANKNGFSFDNTNR